MKNYLIILIGFISMNACSSLFWRAGNLSTESIVSEKSVLEYTVVYLERDSWNPLNGTTIKKSYQTELTLFPSGKSGETKKIGNLTSWTLPGLVAYHSKTDRLVWVQGMNDEYGTYLRKLGFANQVSTNGLQNSKFYEPNQQIWSISLSEDADTIGFVTSGYGQDLTITAPKLGIWKVSNSQPTLYELPEWLDSPNYSIQWKGKDLLIVKLGETTMKMGPSGWIK